MTTTTTKTSNDNFSIFFSSNFLPSFSLLSKGSPMVSLYLCLELAGKILHFQIQDQKERVTYTWLGLYYIFYLNSFCNFSHLPTHKTNFSPFCVPVTVLCISTHFISINFFYINSFNPDNIPMLQVLSLVLFFFFITQVRTLNHTVVK